MSRLLALERRHEGVEFREIRRRIDRGDPGAWALFVERYSRTLYTVALRLASGPEREEIAQQAYLAVLERLARDDCELLRRFRGESRIETYLFSAVRNEVAHLRRGFARDRARSEEYEDTGAGPDTGAPQPTGFAEAIGLDPDSVSEIVAQSLARLAPRERLVLRLRFQDGLPYRRLAEFFGWKDTNAAAYELCKILRKLDLLERCRDRLRWGEPEREVILAGLRGWLKSGAD